MHGEKGFTLIEMMVAVAILGILAGVLVYSFNQPARKVRTGTEVAAIFTELHRAEAQYAAENSAYLSTGDTDSDLFPSTPREQGNTVKAADLPAEWKSLRIQPHTEKIYCGYVAVAGGPDDELPGFADEFDMTQPPGNWYALYARCNADGNSDVDATYFSSSVDTTLQKRNEGR